MEEGGVRPLELQGQGGDGAGLKEDKSKPFLEREVVRKKYGYFQLRRRWRMKKIKRENIWSEREKEYGKIERRKNLEPEIFGFHCPLPPNIHTNWQCPNRRDVSYYEVSQ